MIKEFMKSKTTRDLVIVTNVEKNKFFEELREKTHFEDDKRIKFVGTVYNQELLKKIRENAYAYLHGHEVGGTNPSLLEALATTKLNILLDVGFNREVAEDGAIYFKKEGLSNIIDRCDQLGTSYIEDIHHKATIRINNEYTWNKIIMKYELVFKGKCGE